MAFQPPSGNGSNGSNGAASAPEDGSAARARNPALEKLERDCIKLIDALSEMERNGEEQSLRSIAARTGLSKDEVNRYLNPTVQELYNYERLLHVRRRNRPLYNHLIVSGPPRVGDDGKWNGIDANTSKFVLFKAVAHRFGWDVRYLGARGHIVGLEYRGIENMMDERMGKVFATQEPVMRVDEFLPH